jgi:hypothetical protein
VTTSLLAASGVFTTSHIALTAAITGAVALAAALLLLGRRRSGLADAVAIAILSAAAVFLWRKSANMPQLNDDGLPPFSANDWLAPVLTYVVLSMYATVRRTSNDRRLALARTLAVLAAFAVNVITI